MGWFCEVLPRQDSRSHCISPTGEFCSLEILRVAPVSGRASRSDRTITVRQPSSWCPTGEEQWYGASAIGPQVFLLKDPEYELPNVLSSDGNRIDRHQHSDFRNRQPALGPYAEMRRRLR